MYYSTYTNFALYIQFFPGPKNCTNQGTPVFILFFSSCYFIDMKMYIFFIVLSHSFIGTIFFFAVPYYEENRLDAARRDNKELNIFFEAPYSTKGNSGNQDSELANSSK